MPLVEGPCAVVEHGHLLAAGVMRVPLDDPPPALAIVTLGILGPDFFREVAAILEAAGGGPPDLAAIVAVMGRHGLTPAP